MSAYVTQSDLEARYGVDRVAQVFSLVDGTGTSTGAADAGRLAYAIRMGSARVDRILIGIHEGDMPFVAPYPDTLIELVGPIVMHLGASSHPEWQSEPKKSPYYEDAMAAEKSLADLRIARERLSKDVPPANVGGQVATSLPTSQQPFFFVPDDTGNGGFGSGGY